MAVLQGGFRKRAARDLALFECHLAADDLGAKAVEETAHKLAGTAAILGFAEVGEAACAIDRIFASGGRPDRSVVEVLTACLAAAARAGAAPQPSEGTDHPGGGETILIVEDDDLIRTHAERQLQRLGYRVIVAPDGDAVLAGLETLPPVDLLFTDLMLPGAADGWALARALKEARPGLRVLFTSGRPAVGGGGGKPPAGFLDKPYRRDTLAAMVREVLDGGPRNAG